MAVVALLFESATAATSGPWTSWPDWVSRPVTLPEWVRSWPGHTRARWWSTRDPGTQSPDLPKLAEDPEPHPSDASPPGNQCSSRPARVLFPPVIQTPTPSWLTRPAPEEQVAQAVYPAPEEQAAHDHLGQPRELHQFPLVSSGRSQAHSPLQACIDLQHPLIVLLLQDLYAPCHLEACLQQALSLMPLLRHLGDWHRASPHLSAVNWGHKGHSQRAHPNLSYRRQTPSGSSPPTHYSLLQIPVN